MTCLETRRLILRPFRAGDLDDLCPIFGDADVMRYVGKGARTREETQEVLLRMIGHWQRHGFGMWALVDKEQARLLGRCGLCFLDNTPEVELGYTLAKSAWGKGLATEAAHASLKHGFGQLRLDRIVAIARPENQASRRVMEKVGMHFEKDAHFYQADVVYYAVSRQAYGC
ncbi:MAG TPA: GNAT family N-acetyltransferase [Gemmataceae bacterium]|jgi:ribosomal-protein-alanine N-acetyltransferase|nr:GNAT family N-acetyltransferase [Gemmataceae bacterium]